MVNDVLMTLTAIDKYYTKGSHRNYVHRDFNAEVRRGEFLAIMGPSGCGKTTLLNLITGLDFPDSGSIEINGSRLDKMSDRERSRMRSEHFGFVFQSSNLLPTLSCFRNVELPLLLTHLSKQQRREQVELALELVSLTEQASQFPRELSGGQEQRCAIARAIVTNPTILVCDEPTGNLDRALGDEILQLFSDLHRKMGKTIVMVSHDAKAREFATRIIELE